MGELWSKVWDTIIHQLSFHACRPNLNLAKGQMWKVSLTAGKLTCLVKEIFAYNLSNPSSAVVLVDEKRIADSVNKGELLD